MLSIFTLFFSMFFAEGNYYHTSNGKVTFESKATLEKIIAVSDELKGVLDPKTNTFSFTLELNSFKGFNSELQRDHYEENYVESDKYPKATFNGKIIEVIDYSDTGIYEVRAKGNFELHGLVFNKIINSRIIVVNSNELRIISNFQLNLREYNIKVPRLVHKKVAENINVKVDILMKKQ